MPADGLYIVLISVHGLLRSRSPELGRDADTGGQIQYVLELARALIDHPKVERVDIVTRLIEAEGIDDDYGRPEEPIVPGLSIVRLPCGPKHRYLRKEVLWPHLDSMLDDFVQHLRAVGRAPDLVHGHYADAGYVAAQASGLLDVPMAFTGHSLGRIKRQRLRDGGASSESIEKRYHITRRIEAEETALHHAAFVVASTGQEVEEQYARYEYYQRRSMLVIPPGVDLERFSPAGRRLDPRPAALERLRPFLRDPSKPMVLAINRADPRKNLSTLIRAFGESRQLRDRANLVIVAGTRTDIDELDSGAREVWSEILRSIDRFDLYGTVAIPKQHDSEDIPNFYRVAAASGGVFVNPALTEPFGLTLLEAAASGLPVVATQDGGPRDILAVCRNGLLVDPLDAGALASAISSAIDDRARWKKWSRNGIRGAREFSWQSHVEKYLKAVQTSINSPTRDRRFQGTRSRLITADRVLVTDIDNTLLGDREALAALLALLREAGGRIAFGIATGRSLDLARQALEAWKVPTPQLMITSVGTAIHYGRRMVEDKGWEHHIHFGWRPDAIRAALDGVPGLELQSSEGQGPFKISYDIDQDVLPPLAELRKRLRRARLKARLICSHRAYLDVLPIRASKGAALRYFCLHWGILPQRCLVAGDSGNDAEMLTGNTLGVVVGNHDEDLEHLRGDPRIFFAPGHHAWGIIDGIRHYGFADSIRVPETEAGTHVAGIKS